MADIGYGQEQELNPDEAVNELGAGDRVSCDTPASLSATITIIPGPRIIANIDSIFANLRYL